MYVNEVWQSSNKYPFCALTYTHTCYKRCTLWESTSYDHNTIAKWLKNPLIHSPFWSTPQCKDAQLTKLFKCNTANTWANTKNP